MGNAGELYKKLIDININIEDNLSKSVGSGSMDHVQNTKKDHLHLKRLGGVQR